MSQTLSEMPNLLVLLRDDTCVQRLIQDPWQFMQQLGITPQILFAAELTPQLPGFDDEGGISTYAKTTSTPDPTLV